MLTSWFTALLFAGAVAFSDFVDADQWDARADAIIANFTVDDLVGQMNQIAIGSLLETTSNNLNETAVRRFAKLKVGSYLTSPFTRGLRNGERSWTAQHWREIITRIQEITMEENGGHPMIYGIDAAHGSAFVQNTVIFPHQLNAGAAFNATQVYEMGRITGRDTVAAGIPWVFGPMLEIAQNPLWARNYESFGEDPYAVSVMADAVVRGLQSNKNVAACMKHFIAYSKLPSGHDKDGVTVSDFDLLNYFAPPFLSAIKAGVMSGMENYISINGVPTVANTKIMNDLLRHDMGFNGMMVTDYAEINSLFTFHRVVNSPAKAVELSLAQTTIDMSMVASNASFIDYAKAYLEKHPEALQRVKDSARRVVKLKLQVGLYDNPVPGAENIGLVGNSEDVNHALEAARDSIVLLKNKDNVLPLSTSTVSVFLTGHSADNVGYQCGGWSISWTGDSGNALFPHGVSIKQGMEKIVGNNSFTYFNGLNVTGNYTDADLATAVKMASAAEYTIAAIGEDTYAEKSGDINDLDLPIGQVEYVKALAATGTKVILVLFGGRPRLLNGLPDSVHAVIHGLLPGELGGQALAEILYGKVNPSGRLPITYPKDPANIMIPYNHRVSTQCADGTYCKMEWEFGTGLSYTTFAYSNLTLSASNVTADPLASVTASVTVTNSGQRAGKETVLLFLTQPFRLISVPEVKQLKKFKKIELQPGESANVDFTLTTDDWSVYEPQIGRGFKLYAEDAEFVVAIKPETNCDVYNTTKTVTDPLCATFQLSGN